jgi:CRISPR-associated protein Cas2
MYVIITYDANSKRTIKYLKILRQYLIHSQNSVFEGFCTESKLKEIIDKIKKIGYFDIDFFNIYRIENIKYLKKINQNTFNISLAITI